MVVVKAEVNACDELWYDPARLALDLEISLEDACEYVRSATWTLWDMTERQFHGAQCWLDTYRVRPCQRRLKLYQSPVDVVHYVERYDPCSGDVEQIDACYLEGNMLCLPRDCTCGPLSTQSASCRCDNPVVRVAYRTRPNLPIGASRVTLALATEFYNCERGKCALPDYITGVTRQGVSWSFADTRQVIVEGLTGLSSVDRWVQRLNGRGVARLVDPLTSGVIVDSQRTGCGCECGEEDLGS